jgi:hypothetical protein
MIFPRGKGSTSEVQTMYHLVERLETALCYLIIGAALAGNSLNAINNIWPMF